MDENTNFDIKQRIENTNFVHELDRITQAVISAILEAQNTAIVGDPITVPETKSKVCSLFT